MTSASAPENDVDVDDDDVDDDERATKRQKLENVLSAKDFVMDSNVIETLREYIHPSSGGEPKDAIEMLSSTTEGTRR